MENILFLGVPILKHIRVNRCSHDVPPETKGKDPELGPAGTNLE